MPTTQESSALIIQKLTRGYLARKEIQVKTIDRGIIHIRVNGNAASFKKLGIYDIEPTRGARTLNVLSIHPKLFEGRVVGGHQLFNVVQEAPFQANSELNDQSSELAKMFGPNQAVYINGGFYNLGCYYHTYPEHASVGPTVTQTNKPSDVMPIPKEYRGDYCTLSFSDGSCLTSAPLLSHNGKPFFDAEKLKLRHYRYKAGDKITPGTIFHAADPNPRAGISIPGKKDAELGNSLPAKQNRIRLATATSTSRGQNSNGFTMLEWRNTLMRLNQQNQTQGSSLNLDGGGSVMMGVTNKSKKIFEISQAREGRDIPIYISFTAK